MAGIILYLTSGQEQGFDATAGVLTRDEPGGRIIDYSFDAKVGDVTVSDIEISLEPRDYSHSECEKLFEESKGRIVMEMLFENDIASNITTDLKFSESIGELPFSFVYEVEEEKIFDSEGKIITVKDFATSIVIHGYYEEFEAAILVNVKGNPNDSIKARIYRERLQAMSEAESETAEAVTLPKVMEGADISYSSKAGKKNPAFLLLGVIGAIAVAFAQLKDKSIEKQKRKESILRDYPVLLQKMSLYLTAGMNIRNIWITVYEEEKKKLSQSNPLILEMAISVNELQNSIPESVVYKRFGERTGLPELIRFTALLSQNLKKGSSHLRELLDEEAGKAYQDKKQRAIKKGEEAGTKLLLPMMLLLVDVMVIIVVPAFLSI